MGFVYAKVEVEKEQKDLLFFGYELILY